ncbi:MAG: DUF1266 domain-containing protein, partial [Lachnospiraceae bacterium]|nr:DUF1266 domain-containing protein [Lachnospiraceae bacterium]
MKKIWMLIAALEEMTLLLAGCGTAGREEKRMSPEAAVESAEDENEESSVKESIENEDEESSAEESAEDMTEAPSAEKDTEAKKPVTMAGLVGESRKEQGAVEELPQTILWFNATYAPLTYSNGCNWRLVGGWEPTEENAEITKALLQSSWNVKDRETGLETVKNLIQKGHRGKCQEYTEQMAEWGILDLGEEEFIHYLLLEDVGNELGRYAVAYYMYKSGLEPEYMVAWDLCRVNQLYADYYLCGYMTYEEAMDASLTNSLKLQKLYGSWEEMMDGYMTGYMFW